MLFALSGHSVMLCSNARCIAVEHMGIDPRPGWVVELLASLVRWRKQLATVSKRLQKYAAKYEREVSHLKAKIAAGIAELAKPSDLGSELGKKPTTPCVLIEDTGIRTMLRDRIVKANLGERPPQAYLCHACDDPRCVSKDHLFWGSAADNARDCSIKGRRRGQNGMHLDLRIKAWREELQDAEACLASIRN
jgi:hypothetical protein